MNNGQLTSLVSCHGHENINTFRKALKHKRMMKTIINFFVSLHKNLVCKSLSWGQMKINVARLMSEISKSK